MEETEMSKKKCRVTCEIRVDGGGEHRGSLGATGAYDVMDDEKLEEEIARVIGMALVSQAHSLYIVQPEKVAYWLIREIWDKDAGVRPDSNIYALCKEASVPIMKILNALAGYEEYELDTSIKEKSLPDLPEA
jgi:hypothetical protein